MARKSPYKRYEAGLTVLSGLLFWLLSATPVAAQAASLNFSPSSGSYRAGDNFDVTVMVNSPDEAVSAVSGTANYNTDNLDLISVIKSGSIVNMWTVEPSVVLKNGQVRFEGVIYAPGFQGSGGNVLTLRFKTKTVGITDLSFSATSIMASDAMGTNILDRVGGASFAIAPALPPSQALKPRVPARATSLPPACLVGSMTHPDPLMWVADNNPQFTWSLTPDITGVSYYVDGQADTMPDIQSEGLLDSYSVSGQANGVWYFHCRMENNLGWGPAAHYEFRIDKTPPKAFDVKFLDATQTGLGESWLAFRTTDDLSGINQYEVSIDNDWAADVPAGPEYDWKIFSPSTLDPGEHDVEVVAFDMAGNSMAATRHLIVALHMSLWDAALALEGWKLALLLAALLLTILVIVRLLWTLYPCPTRQELRRQTEELRRQCEKLVELMNSQWKDIDLARRHPRRLIWGEGDRCFRLKKTIDAADRAIRRAVRRLGKKK